MRSAAEKGVLCGGEEYMRSPTPASSLALESLDWDWKMLVAGIVRNLGTLEVFAVGLDSGSLGGCWIGKEDWFVRWHMQCLGAVGIKILDETRGEVMLVCGRRDCEVFCESQKCMFVVDLT